jgi:hypothetical protein
MTPRQLDTRENKAQPRAVTAAIFSVLMRYLIGTLASGCTLPNVHAAGYAHSQPRPLCGLPRAYAMRSSPALGAETGALTALFGGSSGFAPFDPLHQLLKHEQNFFDHVLKHSHLDLQMQNVRANRIQLRQEISWSR